MSNNEQGTAECRSGEFSSFEIRYSLFDIFTSQSAFADPRWL